MRKIQITLDDDLWNALKTRAKAEKTSVSGLLRIAVKEKYLNSFERRKVAMEAIVGLWKDRPEFDDVDAYIRRLRDCRRRRRYSVTETP
ncbi:ribbon-helix-helix protein, CopG family [Acidicapsa dinghuensis]|uniref:Ribbon-helix-helix protein, CopG family n=1 Tax=Acidicapsa dinghuensis TaxID=2218256 RepID=A0ABW1EKE5_9BACT|nr:ribbon-helix-helix protein, CopG family [Acidicapsa dinghuensis]